MLRFVTEGQKNGVETKTEEYEKAKLNIVTKQGKRGFAYAYANELLVVSNTPEAVKRVLDVRAGKVQSLETNETFKQARAAAPGVDGMFGFLDGAALTRIVDGAAGAGRGREARGLPPALPRPRRGERPVGLVHLARSRTAASSSASAWSRPNARACWRRSRLNPPTEGKLLALVPETAVQAFDASVANAPQTFDQMFALASQLSSAVGQARPRGGLGAVHREDRR